MNPQEPKGEEIGSITLHINSKLRVSHISIAGDGDLVARRTVQDSSMLIFRAMAQRRAERKRSGVEDKKKLAFAEAKDQERLENFRREKALRKEQEEREIRERIEARKQEAATAAEKASVRIKPGYSPSTASPGGSREEKKAAARAAAEVMVNQIVSKKSGKVLKPVPESVEPVSKGD